MSNGCRNDMDRLEDAIESFFDGGGTIEEFFDILKYHVEIRK